MQLANKKIGIWGLGVTGKAAATFLLTQKAQISVMDRTLTDENERWLAQKNITFYLEKQRTIFFEENDCIIPSPGLDLQPLLEQYQGKWLFELDLFQDYFRKPIIAITGTVGKTTITHLLSQLLKNYSVPIATGGNIGTGSLELIAQQQSVQSALLEVSSFQLEHCTRFAPDLAIITNCFANHLDRHNKMEEYLRAKSNILAHQNLNQKALVPLELVEQLKSFDRLQNKSLYIFTTQPLKKKNIEKIKHKGLFFVEEGRINFNIRSYYTTLVELNTLPPLTFRENWLIICATLYLQGLSLEKLSTVAQSLVIPEHRLEKVGTIQGIDFYNDSKSTTSASTLAAVNQLQPQSILLFLGGLSKGTNRTSLIKALQHRVKKIYCFGAEAPALHALCERYAISSQSFSTLAAAFDTSLTEAKSGNCILFSPSGSSFDLYQNYKQRGQHFTKLVQTYKRSIDF